MWLNSLISSHNFDIINLKSTIKNLTKITDRTGEIFSLISALIHMLINLLYYRSFSFQTFRDINEEKFIVYTSQVKRANQNHQPMN